MKRLFAWVAGAAGGLAAYRAVRGKRPETRSQPDAVADARAEELKARLRQAREAAGDRDAPQSGEVTLDEAEPLDPQARRAQVHAQGRAALDEMRGDQSL